MTHPLASAADSSADTRLLRFRVGNSRSLREVQELSLVTDGAEAFGGWAMTSTESEIGVSPLAGLFGANASGKTNLLTALAEMGSAVRDSLSWLNQPYPGLEQRLSIPREPFGSADDAAQPTAYEIDVLLDGVRWTYGFELGDSRVEAEWIHTFPNGRRQVWLDRKASRDGKEFQWPGGHVKHPSLHAQITRENSLLLSTAGATANESLAPLVNWFRNNLNLIQPSSTEVQKAVEKRLYENADARRFLAGLVATMDLGITDITIDPRPIMQGIVLLEHRTEHGSHTLTWGREASGARAALTLLARAATALMDGSVLLVDDLGSDLHPRVAGEILRMFRMPFVNTKGAQLVFASHQAVLLHRRLLDPTQAWMVEKNHQGATEVYRLTDCEPGEEESVLNSYLDGAFGAIPDVTEGSIGRRFFAQMTIPQE
ncbi:ATP-binding protein [Streptomyces sp. NPDC051572]|uniref:AAA family ATPase n=1 Tax=Streptomyces sp. NPDC051572 TaxID=3155802 RepID=UPI0034509822